MKRPDLASIFEQWASMPHEDDPEMMDETCNEIPERGDTIRTNKTSMDGKVESVNESGEVFFRIADGRLMKTHCNNVTVVEKLADEDHEIMEDQELLELSNELLTKYKTSAADASRAADAMGDIKTGNKRFSGVVKATNKQFANDAKKAVAAVSEEASPEEIVANLGIPAKGVPYVMALVHGKIKFNDLPQPVRMALYKKFEGMPTDQDQNTSPELMRILKKAVDEGSMGGINRSRPAQDVSYEHVLDRNPETDHSRVIGEIYSSVMEQWLMELSSGGNNGGNGPYQYGHALIEFSKMYSDMYDDSPGMKDDQKEILDVGNTFITKGMDAGREAFFSMDTLLRDDSAEYLESLDFNVEKDLYDWRDAQPLPAPRYPNAKMPEENFKVTFSNPKHKSRMRSLGLGVLADNAEDAKKKAYEQLSKEHSDYLQGAQVEVEPINKSNLNELSVEKLRAYKDAAKSSKAFQTRPMRKLAKTSQNVNTANDKIAAKTGNRKPQPHSGMEESEVTERLDPWQGYTKDDKKAGALAKAPKSNFNGTPEHPLSELIQDTINTHGVKWAFEYYCIKHGLPPRQFRILSGI